MVKSGESHTCLLFKSSFKSSHLAFWRANRLIFCWSSNVMWMSESLEEKNCKMSYYLVLKEITISKQFYLK